MDGRLFRADKEAMREETENRCKGLPKGMIKFINMQTALCPIGKAREIRRQCSADHLNSYHQIKFQSSHELISIAQ